MKQSDKDIHAEKLNSSSPNAEEYVHTYPGDLSKEQKLKLTVLSTSEEEIKIIFNQTPSFNVTIRTQDLFNSQAQVIVNAANTCLGGGGGIDGLIHTKGGDPYRHAHQALKEKCHSNYTEGYASLVESGWLKNSHSIAHVIVVAGPQGDLTPKKEDQLYSCYYNSLVLAHKKNKTSIAFPSISTGVFRFPKDRAASISLKAIQDFVTHFPDTCLKTISIHFLANEKAYLQNYLVAATL
jgi:O-acetyl-ADP-ribose deacetylase